MTTTTNREELTRQINDGHQRVLAAATDGSVDPKALHRLADLIAIAAFDLQPLPVDPAEHVRMGYALMRPRLERLAQHDSQQAVSITSEDGYTYTFHPRTVLRRVLDHALDHLNQVEQWLEWQATGVAQAPTDGWASSEDRLDEDSLPLTQFDLDAWLWRLDRVWELLARRAAQLTPEQLNWRPAPDEWNLGRVLHHVSRGFYTAWLDQPLPDEPIARYSEASRRLSARLDQILATPPPPETGLYGREARTFTFEEVLSELLAAQRSLLASA